MVEQVLDRIGDTSSPLAEFARLYLRRIPWNVVMTPADAYHEVVGLYRFIEHRPDRMTVRAFNPTPDEHGYHPDGSVVEINVDDASFLVDSVTNELQSGGARVLSVLHPVIGTTRDDSGRLISVQAAGTSEHRESVQHYVLDRHLDPPELVEVERRLTEVVSTVLAAVGDFPAMMRVIDRMVELVRLGADRYREVDIVEAVAFLEWLRQDNFVFLGYREYELIDTDDGLARRAVAGSGLGILADEGGSSPKAVPLSSLPDDLVSRYEKGDLLVISKTNRESVVHRRARMDYVGVRLLGPGGETVGEARLLGLFTSKAYMESTQRIPILRLKVKEISAAEDLIAGSHDHKAMVALVEGFPKDELFGLPTEDLRRVLMGLLSLQERALVRLFVRRDLLDRGVRALVVMPRERYSSELGRKLQALLVERFGGTDVDYHLTLTRSDLARLHFTVWVPEGRRPDFVFEELDAEVKALTRNWTEQVGDVLRARHGAERADELIDRWGEQFPSYYRTSMPLGVAAGDIEHVDELERGGHRFMVGVQNEQEGPDVLTRVALYERAGKRPLSDLTPALEDMGMVVVEEVPTRLIGPDDVFIHDFGVLGPDAELLDIEASGRRVAAALEAIWEGTAETDSLNRLVLSPGLDHHQVAILRAYQTYWRRVSATFSVRYVNDALVANPDVTAGLVRLFSCRFDPNVDAAPYTDLRDELIERIEAVPSLDQDRILSGFLRLIEATVRTNAFRPDRSSLAFKFTSADVPDMPVPRPLTEVFVMGEQVEGIHLRAGLRARGGIRWSERREDYRTEVLGLMKAQITKNSIIVPTGAKGGFVLRRQHGSPEETREAVRSSYEVFIRALLDLADNLVDGKVVHPPFVRVHDGPDPYVVVAADRGTARFSDIANGIASEYGFWLDDAFASGGASGYDHKELGITARGAWKSLERHFIEIGIDPRREVFTAVGVGDMSGDVFGNGMLESETIALVAAFDHRHIFVDPNPEVGRAYRERRRLFELATSSWDDYDRGVISPGGGVFARSAKRIAMSEPARLALGTNREEVTPSELIRIILRAPVDLLWNGGIGTYVKATEESDEAVGDRTNDGVRVNGSDIRARVVVEGGNLGFTQRARIEFARGGGRVNADFIDNSGGVNCSDREVNIKILLRQARTAGLIEADERDGLLAASVDGVVLRILDDSFHQGQALSFEEAASSDLMDAYEELMASLEGQGILDRSLELLPSTADMADRSRLGAGLTRPELAVLSAYSKRSLAEELLSSELVDSPATLEDLNRYFPSPIADRFTGLIWEHPLRRELAATIVANEVVDAQGATFVPRLVARTGRHPSAVVQAYRTARDVAGGLARRRAAERLFGAAEVDTCTEMMRAHVRLVATLTRWCLRHEPEAAAAPDELARLEDTAETWAPTSWWRDKQGRIAELEADGIPAAEARRSVMALDLVHVPNIVEVARHHDRSTAEVGRLFLSLGRRLRLDDLQVTVATSRPADPWQSWALEAIEDDLLAARRDLAERVLAEDGGVSVDEAVDGFAEREAHAIDRALGLIDVAVSGDLVDPAPLLVVVRQIQALTM